MRRHFKVISEIPSARDLLSFDYFDPIPVGTILFADSITIRLPNGMNVCDIGTAWHKRYLEEVQLN